MCQYLGDNLQKVNSATWWATTLFSQKVSVAATTDTGIRGFCADKFASVERRRGRHIFLKTKKHEVVRVINAHITNNVN